MHLQRNALHNELHARPSMYFDAPAQVYHLAFLDEGGSGQAIVRTLCNRHIALADPDEAQGEFPVGSARLKWERHTEFLTLTLPVARALSTELRQSEAELVTLSDANAEAGPHDARALLERITRLSARVTQTRARTRLRFSATEAYAQLVFERIAELHEGRTGDCQQLGTFIAQRFRPTLRYCASTDQRLSRLGDEVAHLGNLLQARVQVEMEAQNSQILQSLSTRADTQIKIQKAVEGLSIIAISYYLFNLFKLLYEGILTLGVDLAPRTALLAGTPVAALLIGAIIYQIRNTRRH